MASAFALLITSCAKDEANPSVAPETDGQYDMYYRILSFIETMEGKDLTNPKLQPRTVYSPADVVLYVEGAMNLQYTDPRTSWTSYENKTDTFAITISGGFANQTAVDALFAEVRDSASAHFYSIAETDKFPALYDVTILVQTTSLVTLTVLSKVGKEYRDRTPFGSTDYWDVTGGKCGPYSGGTDDAQDVMNDALNDYYLPYGCVFYTNVTYVHSDLQTYGWSSINSADPIPGDFSIDYRTFIVFCDDQELDPEDPCFSDNRPDCSALDFEEIDCLDPSELNYYSSSIISMYNSYYFDTGLNHITSSIYMDYGLCEYILYFWAPSAHFGTQNSCMTSEFPTYLPQCC